VQRQEQARHRDQRDPVLGDLHQPVDDAHRAVKRFLLGAMQPVVILRVLVVFQVHFDRLGVQDVVHVIGDRFGLSFVDQPGDGSRHGADQRHQPCQRDQGRHRAEPFARLAGLQVAGDAVEDQLQQDQRRQRQHALQGHQRRAGDGPQRPALPDDGDGRAQLQRPLEGPVSCAHHTPHPR